MNRDCQGTIASMSIRASHKRPIRVRAWRSAMGQRLASSRRPLRWPLSRPAINVRMGTAPAKSFLFRRSLVAIRSRDNRLWGDPRCRCARGSDAPCGRKSGPNTLSVSAPAAASLPLAGQGHDDPVSASHDDRPFESRTARGQRPVSAKSLLTHPALSPLIGQFRQQHRPAPRSLWVGLRVDSRGGSDAPAVENVDRSLVDVCPMWDVAPPRCKPQLRTNLRDYIESPEFEERQPPAAQL
jgi:hypothetical protein